MMSKKFFKLSLLLALSCIVLAVSAQTKRNSRTKTNTKPAVKTVTKEEPSPAPTPINTAKKNSRPAAENSGETQKADTPKLNTFVYEFFQPQFVISHIRIDHDENGKGEITFKKKDFDEEYTDPVQFSAVTLEKLKTHFAALNFLDSTENYQHEKDFSHMGTVKITMRSKEGKERTAEYNWTTNEDAKAVAAEYRKLANQYLWIFDMTVARQNQPLETPRIMKSLDGYLRRHEISDPPQMIPFLQDLSNDERVPLITRNDASRLIKEIEKNKKD